MIKCSDGHILQIYKPQTACLGNVFHNLSCSSIIYHTHFMQTIDNVLKKANFITVHAKAILLLWFYLFYAHIVLALNFRAVCSLEKFG